MVPLSVGSNPHPSHFHPEMDAMPSPSLHRALGGIMVNLDDELSRYRHSRTGQGLRPQPQRKLTLRPKGRPSLSLPPRPPKAQPAPSQSASVMAPPTAIAQGEATAYPGISPFPVATGQALAPYMAMPDAYLESTAALLGSSDLVAVPTAHPETAYSATYDPTPYHPDFPQTPDDDYHPSLTQRLLTPLGVGAMLLLLVSSAGFGYLVTSPTALEHLRNQPWMSPFQTASAPDSEAGDVITPAPGNIPTGLQGIGPDLSGQTPDALNLDQVSRLPVEPLRSGAMAPSEAMVPLEGTPNALNRDGGRPLAPTPAATSGAEDALRDRSQPSESTRPTGSLRTKPGGPSTSSGSTSVTVAPGSVTPGPGRPVPPAPVPPAPPSRPAPAATTPPSVPAARPPQPLGTVTTAPAPAPSLPAAPPPPLSLSASAPASNGTNYYVVTDYTGQQSLDLARSVVGDAYLRNFQGNRKIQMGAFSQESSARDLMQELQQRGIPAQVYNIP
jgi:hypothetical protein